MNGDAEALVLIGVEGEVGGEEDGEGDAGLLREAAEERGLILDGMADEVGESDWICDGVLLCCASAGYGRG